MDQQLEAGMRDLFGRVARAADREDVPRYLRAVVTSVAPTTVVLDDDITGTPREADAAWHLPMVGQTCRVMSLRGDLTIVALKPLDWVPITLAEDIIVTNDSPAEVILDPAGLTVHSRGNLIIPAGITTSTYVDLCQVPEVYRPQRFRRYRSGGYATSGEYAALLFDISSTGLIRAGRADGPAGAATVTTVYLDLTWPRRLP